MKNLSKLFFVMLLAFAASSFAGDDYCPSGQIMCERNCNSQENTCISSCGLRYGWILDADTSACNARCETTASACYDTCAPMWGCYGAT